MELCARCQQEKELLQNATICEDCHKDIMRDNFGKRYHPVDVAEKLDKLEKRVTELESKLAVY